MTCQHLNLVKLESPVIVETRLKVKAVPAGGSMYAPCDDNDPDGIYATRLVTYICTDCKEPIGMQ